MSLSQRNKNNLFKLKSDEMKTYFDEPSTNVFDANEFGKNSRTVRLLSNYYQPVSMIVFNFYLIKHIKTN